MKTLYTLLLLACTITSAKAQQECGAAALINEQLATNEAAALNLQALEEFTASWTEMNGGQEITNEYVVPVVVHVFHNNTNSTFVSKDHVLDAIRILNRDIRALNPDTAQIDSLFQPVIGGINIRFELAKLDPDGNCTDGITRTATPLALTGDERLKALISWDTQKYLNIWLCASLSFNAGGYSFYPGTAPNPANEGIVCITSQFGSVAPSNASNLAQRTLTHEVGHYFNLRHTWGNSNTPVDTANCSIDDLVDDTPVTAGNRGTCPLNANSCFDTTYYGFDAKDNVQNYMDYAPCESMFTLGQVTRMDAAINSPVGSRLYLWQDSTLLATGVHATSPVVPCGMIADFHISDRIICMGTPITLSDWSWNGTASSRNWSFTGGSASLSSASDSSTTIVFNSPGFYDLALEVTSNTGVVTSKTIAKAVYVFDPSVQANTPYSQDFENGMPGNYTLISDDEPFTYSPFIGMNSNASIYHPNLSLPVGEQASFLLPVTNVKSMTAPELHFDYAYAASDSNSSDLLQVNFSGNCGLSWLPRASLTGNALSTAPMDSTGFAPSAGDWKHAVVNLAAYKNADALLTQFLLTGGGGNGLYVDNINIIESTVGLEELDPLSQLQVYPNPASESLTVSFEVLDITDLNLRVVNQLGMEVFAQQFSGVGKGPQQEQLDISSLPAGIYFLSISTEFNSSIKRFVVAK